MRPCAENACYVYLTARETAGRAVQSASASETEHCHLAFPTRSLSFTAYSVALRSWPDGSGPGGLHFVAGSSVRQDATFFPPSHLPLGR